MTRSTSSASPATRWTSVAGACNSRPAGTADAPATRYTPPCRTLHRRRPAHDKQKSKLGALFAVDEHAAVEVTWSVYQQMIRAYRHPDRKQGLALLTKLIDTQRRGVPAALADLVTLGRALHRRGADVLAYFDRPGTSNGPTEAINGRLEHLRASTLGFRNLTDYIARSLLGAGGGRWP